MPRKTTENTTDVFANVTLPAKNEGEDRSDYARRVYRHVRDMFPMEGEGAVKNGAIFAKFANAVGYTGKSPHGAFYAACGGGDGEHTTNGTSGSKRGAKTKDDLIAAIAKLETSINDDQIKLESMKNSLLTWDQDHADDEKKAAEKKQKVEKTAKEFLGNTLANMSMEERMEYLTKLAAEFNTASEKND